MSHTSIFQEEFWLWQQVAYRQHAACKHLLGSTIHGNTVKIPGSTRGDILLSATYCQNQNLNYRPVPEVSEGKWWILCDSNPGLATKHPAYHIRLQLRPFHQDLGSEKHENTSHENYPSFRISFDIELKRSHVKVEFPKFVVEVFNMPKFHNKYSSKQPP